jgi:biotin carboxyl carrier protein
VTARRLVLLSGGAAFPVDVFSQGGHVVVRVGGRELRLTLDRIDAGILVATYDGQRIVVHHAEGSGVLYLHIRGETYTFERSETDRSPARPAVHHDLRAPMPGVVTKLFVAPGQVVDSGDALFALEAMKMETVVRAAARARVTRLHASLGSQVEGGAVVVELDDLPDAAHEPEEESG